MNQAELISSPATSGGKVHPKNQKKHVAVLFYRVGPYHYARLRAAGAGLRVTAVEFSDVDPTYAWDLVQGQESFDRVMLFQGIPVGSQSAARIVEVVGNALTQLRPDAVAIPGWYDRCSLAALKWCTLHRVPAILMSETTAWDDERKPWREFVKRRVVRLCAAGLAGGNSHADYLAKLGMPRDRIFLGYDAVDNEYFARKSEEVRSQWSVVSGQRPVPASLPSPLCLLPPRFFLASARFVEKKNLPRLIEAYARYRQLAAERGPQDNATTRLRDNESEVSGPSSRSPVARSPMAPIQPLAFSLQPSPDVPWSLVLIGDGPLRPDLSFQLSTFSFQADVHLPGFKQYHELPVYYGLASAFIHSSTVEQWGLVVNEAMASGLPVLVSNRCGCAADLVKEGVNGFTFDPENVEQLAQLMLKISAFNFPLSAFGTASQDIIGEWGPSRFGDGLCNAVASALKRPPTETNWWERAWLTSLVHGANRFHSIDDRPAQGAIAKRRDDGKAEYLVFSVRGRNVLAVPKHPRKIRLVALSRYQPYTPKRQLYSRVLRTAMMLRCEKAFARQGPIPLFPHLGLDHQDWLNTLRQRLGFSRGYAILAWPSQPTRQRIYAHFVTEDLDPFAFVKIAPKSTDDAELHKGAAALRELCRLPFKRIRLPQVLGEGQSGSIAYTVLEPLPITAKPPRFNRDYDLSPFLSEISHPPVLLAGEAIAELSWWNEYTSRLDSAHQTFHTELVQSLPRGAEVCRAHGDIGLSNMVLDKDTLWLFDWENSHPAAPVMTDRVGYFLSFSVGKVASRAEPCLRDFQDRFLRGASPQHRLDVMLALAFRFACGISDARVYIANWPSLLPPPRP